MAKVSNPVIGNASGSVGGLTFSKWKGINVMKQKPTSVAQPASDTRDMHQSALSQIVIIYRLLSSVINLTFKSLAVNMSSYNAFSSFNLKNAFDFSTPPTATLLPANLLISKGTIASTFATTSMVDVSDGDCTITFPTTTTGANQQATDLAVIVVYNVTKNTWEGKVSTGARSTGTASIDLTAVYATTDSCRVYLAFLSESGNKASDSTVTTVTPQA